jgi:hypothetical protein
MSSSAVMPMRRRFFLWAGLVLVLAGCGSDQSAFDSPPQQWKGLDVRVETRPSPPVAGMDEFLVIITGERGQPAWDCLVDIRTSDADPWKQSIQDGRVGVYRRAAQVEPGERSVLQVQIRRGDDTGVLRFPLNLAGR